ncbi:MAG: DUF554 family protein [Verrucomicrobiota bacterium]
MIGTWLNAGGIALGALAGALRTKPVSVATQNYLKVLLGAFAFFYGLRLVWIGLNGRFLHVLAQIGVVLLALVLGRIAGRLLGLQKMSNRLGRFARDRIAHRAAGGATSLSDGFEVCSSLFCAAPLGLIGAVADGLTGYFYPLAVKAVMDGFATLSFVSMFGWGVGLSAIPVLALQGTLTLFCARFLQPWLLERHLVDPVNATAGLLVVFISLVILEVKKVEITDYLPSLVLAPLLAAWLL